MEILKRLKDRFADSSQSTWDQIYMDATGFYVGSRRVDWTQVTSIAAFKRDVLTFDDVWFQLEGLGMDTLICEEQPGFDNWESELCRRFPVLSGWREKIIQPAFEENFVVLYRRT